MGSFFLLALCVILGLPPSLLSAEKKSAKYGWPFASTKVPSLKVPSLQFQNKSIQPPAIRPLIVLSCRHLDTYQSPYQPNLWTNPRWPQTWTRYSAQEAAIRIRIFTPYLNDYIPQGIHRVGETTYLSLYYKNSRNTDGEEPSIIVRLGPDGRARHVFELWENQETPYHEHVGGVVLHGETFYVPHGETIDLFRTRKLALTPPAAQEEDQIACTRLYRDRLSRSSPSLEGTRNAGFSFLSLGENSKGYPILWTGHFSKENETDIVGFEFRSDGSLETDPSHIFAVPDLVKLQGVALGVASANHYVFYVSRSYGDTPSKIYRLTYDRSLLPVTGFTARSQTTKIYEGPAGVESLTYDPSSDLLWTVSESGADYYQYRSAPQPWDDFYPFTYAIDAD